MTVRFTQTAKTTRTISGCHLVAAQRAEQARCNQLMNNAFVLYRRAMVEGFDAKKQVEEE